MTTLDHVLRTLENRLQDRSDQPSDYCHDDSCCKTCYCTDGLTVESAMEVIRDVLAQYDFCPQCGGLTLYGHMTTCPTVVRPV